MCDSTTFKMYKRYLTFAHLKSNNINNIHLSYIYISFYIKYIYEKKSINHNKIFQKYKFFKWKCPNHIFKYIQLR